MADRAKKRSLLAQNFMRTPIKLLLWFTGVVIVFAGLTAGSIHLATMEVVGRFAETLRSNPRDFGLSAELADFRSLDGTRLKGWWIPAKSMDTSQQRRSSRGTVILAHGSGDNRSGMLSRAKLLAANGYNTFPIDLRAHGESEGRFMTPGYLEALDILGAMEEAKRRGAQGPFVALGHSYGAVASLWAAARSPEIGAVVADGAFLTPEDVTVHGAEVVAADPTASFWAKFGSRTAANLVSYPPALKFAYWAMYVRTGVYAYPGEANSLRAIAQMGDRPVLFISGERDRIAPPEGARRLYEAAASTKKEFLLVPGAGHGSTYNTKDRESAALYERQVLAFFEAALPRDPAVTVPK